MPDELDINPFLMEQLIQRGRPQIVTGPTGLRVPPATQESLPASMLTNMSPERPSAFPPTQPIPQGLFPTGLEGQTTIGPASGSAMNAYESPKEFERAWDKGYLAQGGHPFMTMHNRAEMLRNPLGAAMTAAIPMTMSSAEVAQLVQKIRNMPRGVSGITELPPGWKVLEGGVGKESPNFLKPESALGKTEDPRTWFKGDVPQMEPPANLAPTPPGYKSGSEVYEAAQKFLKELQTKRAQETIPGFEVIEGGPKSSLTPSQVESLRSFKNSLANPEDVMLGRATDPESQLLWTTAKKNLGSTTRLIREKEKPND